MTRKAALSENKRKMMKHETKTMTMKKTNRNTTHMTHNNKKMTTNKKEREEQ